VLYIFGMTKYWLTRDTTEKTAPYEKRAYKWRAIALSVKNARLAHCDWGSYRPYEGMATVVYRGVFGGRKKELPMPEREVSSEAAKICCFYDASR
jgi:hypothetical protein